MKRECPKHPLLSRMGDCGCEVKVPDSRNITSRTEQKSSTEQIIASQQNNVALQQDFDPVELLQQLELELCKKSLSEFVKAAWPMMTKTELEWGPHVETMCWHIQQQLEDAFKARKDKHYTLRAQNLLINIPPRSLKTTVLICANAWAWLHDPTMQIMYLSANPRVASNSARTFRDLIASPWFQTFKVGWSFRADQDALGDMGNTAGGKRMARGMDSIVVGEGSDWICIDDPHDLRDTQQLIQKTNDGYDSAVANRLNDYRSGIRTCIMQRVMVSDFSDHILRSGDWLHLRLPMTYESKTECQCGTCVGVNVYGWQDWRSEGEIIHPRYSESFLESELRRLGPMGYAGQLQQRPGLREGNLFKIHMWEFCNMDGNTTPKSRPEGARVTPSYTIPAHHNHLDLDDLVLSVDPSGGSLKDGASAVGMTLIGIKGERRFILEDFDLGPRGPQQQIDDLKVAIVRAGAIAGKQRSMIVLIEKKALGAAVGEQIEKAIKDGDLRYPDGSAIRAEVKFYEPTGKGDKAHRADHLEPDMHAGLIYLLDGAPWVGKYVQEFGLFPSGGRDDKVDALAQCCDTYRNYTTSNWTTAAEKLLGWPKKKSVK